MTGVRTGRGTSKNHSASQVRERLLCAPGEQVVRLALSHPGPGIEGSCLAGPGCQSGEPSSESTGPQSKAREGLCCPTVGC